MQDTDSFCRECGNDVEELDSSESTTDGQSSSGDSGSSNEEMTFTERVKDIQEKGESSNTKVDETTNPTGGSNSDDEGTSWTLSLVVGGLMSVSALFFGIYYAVVAGNIVSGVLFGVAGLFGNWYLSGESNLSKWLAVAIFLLFWMAGSFFIGTGAA